MNDSGQDFVARLLDQAAGILAKASLLVSTATPHPAHLADHLHQAAQRVDQAAKWGLLPLCLALLVLHEQFRASTEGGVFRVGYVLGRAAGVVALVLAYSQVCGLITFVAGGGHWMSNGELLNSLGDSSASIGEAWHTFGSFSDWPKFVIVILVSFILICAVLFAYVAGILLSTSQSAILSVLLILGKPCIIVSLVPGVGIGKSWARSLAEVAAWSTIAGIITSILGSKMPELRELVRAGQMLPMLRASAHFIVLAVGTLAVPKLVSMIFSGAVTSAAGGLMGAVATGYLGLKSFGAVSGRMVMPKGGTPPGTRDGGAGASSRIHKVRFEKMDRFDDTKRSTAQPPRARKTRPESVTGADLPSATPVPQATNQEKT